MRKFRWYLHTGFSGCTHEGEVEFDDNDTDAEIEETIKDEAFSEIDWGYEEVE